MKKHYRFPAEKAKRRPASVEVGGSTLPVVPLVVGALAVGLVGVAVGLALGGGGAPKGEVKPSEAEGKSVIDRIAEAQGKQETEEWSHEPEGGSASGVEEGRVEEPFTLPDPDVATAWARGRTSTGVVERVVDGDTVHLTDGRKIRLVGINTPEMNHGKPRDPEPLAPEATALLEELVGGQEIVIELDEEAEDQFGRTLGYVYRGEVFVNGELVRQGLAYCYTWEPNTAHVGDLLEYQREARREERGLWGLPAPAAAAHYEAPEGGHRFHRPDCRRLERERGRRVRFETRNEAFDEGLNPCSTCDS